MYNLERRHLVLNLRIDRSLECKHMVIWFRRLGALALFIVAVVRPVQLLQTSALIWIAAMITSLTFFIAECFSPALTFTSGLGTAYLLVTGIIYAWAGVLGLVSQPQPGLVEPFVWSFLVSPFVWITLVTSHGGGYDVVLLEPHPFSSAVALCLGLIAVGAALAMSRSKKIGYQIWIALLCLIIFQVGGYVVAAILYEVSNRLWIACGWLITYMLAFWLAYRGSEPYSTKST